VAMAATKGVVATALATLPLEDSEYDDGDEFDGGD